MWDAVKTDEGIQRCVGYVWVVRAYVLSQLTRTRTSPDPHATPTKSTVQPGGLSGLGAGHSRALVGLKERATRSAVKSMVSWYKFCDSRWHIGGRKTMHVIASVEDSLPQQSTQNESLQRGRARAG